MVISCQLALCLKDGEEGTWSWSRRGNYGVINPYFQVKTYEAGPALTFGWPLSLQAFGKINGLITSAAEQAISTTYHTTTRASPVLASDCQPTKRNCVDGQALRERNAFEAAQMCVIRLGD